MHNESSKQTWTPASYQKNAAYVADLGSDVLGWLAPAPGEKILDLGCGDGALTIKIANAGASVVGVDTSQELLAAARKLGLDVHYMDGHALTFDHEFDAVFSNAALHWMTQPEQVAVSVRNALRPNGRFVGEFGGHGNVAAIVTAMRAVGHALGGDPNLAGPWYYPTADEYTELLTANGFKMKRAELFPRHTPLPAGISGWLTTFRQPFFDQFPLETRQQALNQVINALAPSLCDSKGKWHADYVRLRFYAEAI